MRFLPLIFLLQIIVTSSCKEERSTLKKMVYLSGYSSGSGLAQKDKKIYLMGDDATFLLITDTAFKTIDTIHFFNSPGKRIPKNIKQDPEALAIISKNDTAFILMMGSGSAEKLRDFCWLINSVTKQKTEIKLDTFYDRLRAQGIKDLNIEGATSIPGGILLASRGNKSSPKNHLIFTSSNFWDNQSLAGIHIATMGVQKDTASFEGVSGLDYSVRKDLLYLTVSTENTYNSYEDGTIGKSYLWIVKDLSLKRNYAGINPFKIIDLEAIDVLFKNQKIESVAIISDLKNGEEIVLVSDDDKGGSVLFKAEILREKN